MIFYLMVDFEGKLLRFLIVILRIKKIFFNLIEESLIFDLVSDLNMLNKIIILIFIFNELILVVRRDFDKEDIEEYWLEVYNWFK